MCLCVWLSILVYMLVDWFHEFIYLHRRCNLFRRMLWDTFAVQMVQSLYSHFTATDVVASYEGMLP